MFCQVQYIIMDSQNMIIAFHKKPGFHVRNALNMNRWLMRHVIAWFMMLLATLTSNIYLDFYIQIKVKLFSFCNIQVPTLIWIMPNVKLWYWQNSFQRSRCVHFWACFYLFKLNWYKCTNLKTMNIIIIKTQKSGWPGLYSGWWWAAEPTAHLWGPPLNGNLGLGAHTQGCRNA